MKQRKEQLKLKTTECNMKESGNRHLPLRKSTEEESLFTAVAPFLKAILQTTHISRVDISGLTVKSTMENGKMVKNMEQITAKAR